MVLSSKSAAMAAGLVAVLAAVTVAQNQAPAGRVAPRGAETLVVGDATVDWIEKSNVSALREGVIDKMELEVGDEVKRDGTIGILHREIARLTVSKADVAAKNKGPIEKAKAQKALASAVLARSYRLDRMHKNAVSKEEIEKNEAELAVAEAMVQEAEENRRLAEAELDLAKRAFDEHEIKAPFDGVITDRLKNPGESVRANEPVVTLGKIDKLRVSGWIPIQYVYRIKVGFPVEVTPNIAGVNLEVEKKKFLGKITFVDPEVTEPIKTEVRVFAEVENNEDHELRPGLKADMVIYLNGARSPAPAVGARGQTQKR